MGWNERRGTNWLLEYVCSPEDENEVVSTELVNARVGLLVVVG